MAHEIEGDRNIAEHILNNIKPNVTETSVDVDNIQEVILVEKPIVKKPTVFIRILLILLAIAVAFALAYGITQITTISNSLKPLINNVQ